MMKKLVGLSCAALLGLGLLGCGDSDETATPSPWNNATGLGKINHFVIIYLENHSFDNLYGEYPGAEGLASSTGFATQVDDMGHAYGSLPQPMDTSKTPPEPDPRFPADLPNQPFAITDFVKADEKIPDLVHRYYQEQSQINGGRMDKFAAASNAKGLTMGVYHTMDLPLANVARDYTLCDAFFHSAFGGSYMNHIYLVSAAVLTFPGAPMDMTAQFDAMGTRTADGAVTPDGYVVNTAFSVNSPHPSNVANDHLVPSQSIPTIGDRMLAKNISFAWYSGGWDDALAGKTTDDSFQYHHQPFVYFDTFKDGTKEKADHLKDEKDFIDAAKAGKLPQVSFVKPVGINNEHPGYADLAAGEAHVVDLIKTIKGSPQWKDTAIIITYDENGGFWDHVPPPKADRWGPGSRVPAIVISPFAKKAYVDHTKYETASILATLEHRFGLTPLSDRDAKAADMTPAFDFNK
jgi:phospholipase C